MDDGDAMQQLNLAVADLTLENASLGRDMRGYLEHTTLVPHEEPMITAALLGGQEHEEEKRKQKGENIGSAHVGICLKSLMALGKSDDLKKPEFQDLENALEKFWLEVVNVKPQQEMAEEICVFKVFKPKHPSKAIVESFGMYSRMVFRFKQPTRLSTQASDLEEQLLAYFKARKWKVMSGTLPKAKKERDVLDCLRQFRR